MKNILKILTLLFILSASGYCSYDTTFKANLYESQKNSVKVSFHYDESGKYLDGVFTVYIDGFKYTDSTQNPLDFFEVKVVDVDKDDDYKEIAIGTFFNESTEYLIYRFNGKKIISLGWVTSMDEPVFPGNGIVKAKGWMGFWSYDYEFIINKSKNKFEAVYKDEYSVKFYEGFDQDIVVTQSFNTYKERDKKSDIVTKFAVGDKIKLIKAYTKVTCEDEYREFCFWYLIQDKNGKKGWIQLKDFNDKVSGLPWAG
jgi:hypothetical protein